MKSPNYTIYILVGFVLVMLGAILPFLMVLRVLESTFFLNFFSYGATLIGLVLGFYAATMYVREHRGKRR